MGLIAGALEERGIRTVCVSTMEDIMKKVRPPRWLALPLPMGYPLGRPRDPGVQMRILRSAFQMLELPGPGPIRTDLDPDLPEE